MYELCGVYHISPSVLEVVVVNLDRHEYESVLIYRPDYKDRWKGYPRFIGYPTHRQVVSKLKDFKKFEVFE